MSRRQLVRVLRLAALYLSAVPALAHSTRVLDDLSPPERSPVTSGYDFLGGFVAGPFDMQNAPSPANTFMYGVEHAFGAFWVTGGDGSAVLNNGLIYKFDLNGGLLAQYPETSIASSTFGHRDGE